MIVAQTKRLSFRCPITQTLVQRLVAVEPSDRPLDRFETVHCAACGLTHMVDWVNGKTIEQD
jgi:hypothetical protein